MVKINKGIEPRSLSRYRATPNSIYSGLPTETKNDIKKKLLGEQGYLCAYCMRRIRLENTQIEHYIAQNTDETTHQKMDLAYSNMLAVCPGNEGNPPKMQTCDEHRGNIPLTVNPLDEHTIQTIEYLADGVITSSDDFIKKDLQETLNLNYYLLKESRKSQLDALKRKLKQRKPNGDWKSLAQKYKQTLLSADGEKQEFIGILIWYLNKKLQQST